MYRHHKRVAYKEENTLRPGDGGSSSQLYPALFGIGNGERISLPYKQNKRIPPNKNEKFGRANIGKNKNPPVAQVNPINASNSKPQRPKNPTSEMMTWLLELQFKSSLQHSFSGRQGIFFKQRTIRPIRYLSYNTI